MSGLDVEAEERAGHLARIEADGWTIVPDAIEPALLDRLDEALARLERDLDARPADNAFEGRDTVRIYNLLAHDPVFQEVPVHPAVLPIVEGVIGRGCLVSSLSSIAIGPDEVAQPLHVDDAVIPLPRPHVPIICNSMWALTDFTAANGATRVVPGSHRADSQPDPFAEIDAVAAEMPRGSVLIWPGSTWHGGGANTTDQRRTGLAMNYCAGWVRQQENQQLGIPLDVARTFPPALRRLCGFGVYRGLIGHIDKHDPAVVLLDEPTSGEPATLFDRIR
ncbi:phytanoyl-CoA dioxygenase [Iamia sp. SCSIO 61187]|uniref:phytanoyl-CoA dioxygenase family protein n=1 Tax=Iamia sp. SCSIO 61187 TaxID=2722752 RepID=UPI001C62D455|nr:phytanoyl-CoA dioxygenase family protein [Iamia sp. SCSIO 61187]QYG93917.1 phytanoyl-CoA dioxygenase [Iamia sp. SCSIO 61187]